MVVPRVGRLKLLFSATKNHGQTGRFDGLIEQCVKELECGIESNFSECVVDFEERIRFCFDHDLCTIQCQLRVKAKTSPLWNIFPKLAQFLAVEMTQFAKKNSDDLLKFHTSIQLQNNSFFDVGARTGANLEMKAVGVHFGNMIEHEKFITHYIVDDDPNNGWYGTSRMMHYFFNRKGELDENENQTIYVDFEHDRRRIIIFFPVLFPKNSEEGRGQKVESVARLTLEYGNIRRFFFCCPDVRDSTLKLLFHLRCPPLVHNVKFVRRDHTGAARKQDRVSLRAVVGDRYRHWVPQAITSNDFREEVRAYVESPYLLIEFKKETMEDCAHVMGRLKESVQHPLEIRHISRYSSSFRCSHLKSPLADNSLRQILMFEGKEDFEAVYLIDALLSRGAQVKDQLLVKEEHRRNFINRLVGEYRKDRNFALASLERLLNTVDESLDMKPLYEMFDEAINKTSCAIAGDNHDDLLQTGYVKLRKVTITPTRKIFEAPELIMGNRILRIDPQNYPPTKFLRVSFRDEDWTHIRPNIGKAFIERFLRHELMNGLVVADFYFPVDGNKVSRLFRYLGSSNSQMREQGCYFIEGTDEEVRKFRERFGSFSLESVPKFMARFGQCFTQSHALEEPLNRNRHIIVPDFEGGSNANGKVYNFSDGVGGISVSFAEHLAKFLKLGDCVPSCFQNRFRGFKGIHAVNPQMDRIKRWAEENGLVDGSSRSILGVDLQFRDSQLKFLTTTTPESRHRFEIVKYSAPSPVALNRPFINILDQVSTMQGFECHARVWSRINELLDLELRNIANTLTDETAARSRLREFPSLVLFDVLHSINLTQEPFFQKMLRISARCALKRLRSKMQIGIPNHLGRSLFGVVDETGTLSYGQIFVRYTEHIFQKQPGPLAPRKILTGPVLVSKNPMLVPGDVRMFEAVDVPALHHFCDVIVFPRWGPRPHPDEMAGSDLDGDEYSVIWDPQLFLLRNEPAFDYTAPVAEPIEVVEDKLRDQMADFFVDYISHDSIGKISVAHLVNSDIYGLDSEVCDGIARKHSQAVDFPKTGIPPERLSKTNPALKKVGEDPAIRPDYYDGVFKPNYVSPRLNGQLYRRVKVVDDTISVAIEDKTNKKSRIDDTFYIDGITEKHMEIARNNFLGYESSLKNILERFGIDSEAEIFSGCYSVIRKQFGDKEDDDMSFYNTKRVLEDEVLRLTSYHRKRLFESIGNVPFREQAEWPLRRPIESESEARIILRSIVREPSTELKRLAVAYYLVAYEQESQHCLSFAWLGADVLSKVRQARLKELHDSKQVSAGNSRSRASLNQRITDHIMTFCELDGGVDQFFKDLKENSNRRVALAIHAYCLRHKGLKELLYVSCNWMLKNKIFVDDDGHVKICLIFIMFGLDSFSDLRTVESSFLEETPWNYSGEAATINLFEQLGSLGKRFSQFLEFISSLGFAELRYVDFSFFEYYSMISEDALFRLHEAAKDSFYRICLTDNFEVLPCRETQSALMQQDVHDLTFRQNAEEYRAFLFEWPRRVKDLISVSTFREVLCEHTGCKAISMRLLNYHVPGSTVQVIASAWSDNKSSIDKLQSLLTPINYPLGEYETDILSDMLSNQVLARILQIETESKAYKKVQGLREAYESMR